jgi:hypothetical protein
MSKDNRTELISTRRGTGKTHKMMMHVKDDPEVIVLVHSQALMTKITLTRINYAPTYTLGFIRYKDFFCFTLEPARTQGKGCIPCGVYPIVWEYSPKFKCNLWELKNVSGRSEIKVHVGNSTKDTEGCILVGYNFKCFEPDDIEILRSVPAHQAFCRLCHDEKITEIEVREV